jgi:hypothetical protein
MCKLQHFFCQFIMLRVQVESKLTLLLRAVLRIKKELGLAPAGKVCSAHNHRLIVLTMSAHLVFNSNRFSLLAATICSPVTDILSSDQVIHIT